MFIILIAIKGNDSKYLLVTNTKRCLIERKKTIRRYFFKTHFICGLLGGYKLKKARKTL